ncbi:AAA family ATPase [Achromobacter mucicolens]|uniref:ParA family protein n=1 Tax=Achromobacter mucicolens TaxID=1389922 RepID=UPI0024534D8E|nr:ArsA-related P-loop ATPase [Achromobacter mucicolens]WGJ88608.1 AAA family ATPase [Achromobacter mucicolens]
MRGKLFEMFPEPAPTFDSILPIIRDWLRTHSGSLHNLLSDDGDWLVVNRDLNGRVRLILPERHGDGAQRDLWTSMLSTLMRRLGAHAYPLSAGILFESSKERASLGATSYSLDDHGKVWIVDRLATEADWTHIEPESLGVPRIVFFSIKGGVGRSTALAATAWSLAQSGKRVLVLDLDLESPGLSTALLPPERQPTYGVTDWLVEDLVDNGEVVLDSMMATSNLSHDGEIHVVPSHGADHGEYISKLGRVWMPKLKADGTRETWSNRLGRLLQMLESRVEPDVILIDSRSGIDEVASACITDMGANLILLFALEGEQTWNGYRMLFEQWQRANVAESIRERLKIVGAIVPELDRVKYLEGLRESAYGVFADTLYDEIAPANPESIGPTSDGDGKWRVDDLVEGWNFDEADEGAPHCPWAVSWHRSFAGLRSLQGRLAVIDAQEVQSVFGPLIDGVIDATASRNP